MKNEITNMYEKIKTPEEWKKDIKAKMLLALEEEKNSNNVVSFEKKEKSRKKFNWAIPVVGVAVAASLGIAVFTNNSSLKNIGIGSSITTEDSELSNLYSEVTFINQGEEFSSGMNLGNDNADDFGENTAGSLSTTYELDNGGRLVVTKLKDGIMPVVDEKDLSNVCGYSMAIIETSKDGEAIYTASFMKDGYVISIRGTGLDKESYVEGLYNIIKKLF